MVPRGLPSKLSVEDEAALRCKYGPRRRCKRSISYKDESQVGRSAITERLSIGVRPGKKNGSRRFNITLCISDLTPVQTVAIVMT